MLDKTTLNQLHDLRLHTMSAKLSEQQNQPDILSFSFDERFGLLVDAEWMKKRGNRIERYVQQAQFRFPAVIEDIDYTGKHGISKKDVLILSEGGYLRKKQNVLVSGFTGIGKTYLICALGRCACCQCLSVRYIRTPDLFLELADAQLDGKYSSYRRRLAKFSLLILDDWGMRPFTIEESHEILELMELRYQNGSTIISSQIPYTSWHELFPDPTVADAILDRIVHNAYKFNLSGESMRKTLAEKEFVRES
ncbi:MAG: IS21-like element helper ATPase IstB [Smithella sp.]